MLQSKEIMGSQNNEKYLVTGSHGHIGSHLYDLLKSRDLNVVRGDRFGNVPSGINRIFDCASYGNKYEHSDINEIYVANVNRIFELLENSSNARSIVLISSSSVLLTNETPYSIAKKTMEKDVKEWVALHDTPVIIVRPSTIVGVGEDRNHLIPKLIDSAFTGIEMD